MQLLCAPCRGGFMLIVVPQKDKEVAEVVDFREVAPLAASKDMFHGNKSLASWVRKQSSILLFIVATNILFIGRESMRNYHV